MQDEGQCSAFSSLLWAKAGVKQGCWAAVCGMRHLVNLVVGTRRQRAGSACQEASLQAHGSEVAMGMFLPASQQVQELGSVSLGEWRIISRKKLENLVNKTLPAC